MIGCILLNFVAEWTNRSRTSTKKIKYCLSPAIVDEILELEYVEGLDKLVLFFFSLVPLTIYRSSSAFRGALCKKATHKSELKFKLWRMKEWRMKFEEWRMKKEKWRKKNEWIVSIGCAGVIFHSYKPTGTTNNTILLKQLFREVEVTSSAPQT